MGFLLDSNCWMQIARNRAHADEVRRLLAKVPPEDINLTDFALHSLAIVMHRHKSLGVFPAFIRSVGIGSSVAIVRLAPGDWTYLVDVAMKYNLDVDDAYVAAELNGLQLVSLDADFDLTPRGRITPAAALQQFIDDQSKQQQGP